MPYSDLWPNAPEGFEFGYVKTQNEYSEFIKLNEIIHNQDDAQMLKRLIEKHPRFSRENNFFLRDTDTGQMVACLNAIPSTWKYDGINLNNLELGFVGTLEEYRNKGFFNSLYKLFEIELRNGNYDMSSIQGIPYFYRKYGYDFMIPLDRWVVVSSSKLRTSTVDEHNYSSFQIRTIGEHDIETLAELYHELSKRFLVTVVRDKELWLAQESTSMYENETFSTKIIEENGKICGYFRMILPDSGLDESKQRTLKVFETSEMSHRCSIMMLSHLKEIATENDVDVILLPGTTKIHPSKLAVSLGGQMTRGWKYQIRIVDLSKFLSHIGPSLEKRLHGSPFESWTGIIDINTYHELLTLHFRQGQLLKVEKEDSPKIGLGGMLRSSPQNLVRLLMGENNMGELEMFDADFIVESSHRMLLRTLFPKQPSFVFYYFC